MLPLAPARMEFAVTDYYLLITPERSEGSPDHGLLLTVHCLLFTAYCSLLTDY